MKRIIAIMLLITLLVGCSSKEQTTEPNNQIPIEQDNDVTPEISDPQDIDWDNVAVFIPEEEGDINRFVNKSDGSMDENGNFIVTGRSYQYDVTSIKITSDDDFAYFLIELADDLDYYFDLNKKNENMGGTIGKFVIDTDNNIQTGEEEMFTKNKGFDKELTLYISTDQDYVYSVGYWLDNMPFDFQGRIDMDSEDDPDYISINENLIELIIPLKELGTDKNQKLRIMFKEDGGVGSFADTFSDVIVKEI